MLHQIGFPLLVKFPNEPCIIELLSKVMFSSWDRLKTMKFFSHTNSQDEKKFKKQIKWREVNETLFLQSCFIACQENIFRRWTEKEKTFVVSIWATADLWVLLAFPDIKSKLCERWWRCSNRNGEWKWANRRSIPFHMPLGHQDFLFCEVTIQVFCPLFWLIWMNSVCTLDTGPLFVLYVANTFSHSVVCLFALYGSFNEQNFLI